MIVEVRFCSGEDLLSDGFEDVDFLGGEEVAIRL